MARSREPRSPVAVRRSPCGPPCGNRPPTGPAIIPGAPSHAPAGNGLPALVGEHFSQGIDVLPQSGLMGRRQRRRHACRREVYPRHGLRRGPTCETPAAIAGSSRATSRSLPGDAVSCTGAARRAPGLLFALPGRMGPIWLDLRISGQPAQDGFVNNRHQLPPHADINGQASHGGIELWVEWRRRFLVVYLKPRRGRGGGQ